tara:strand:+ start:3465 stop:3644 length:180 start_codon:yes stop_codon:yes gene_type:complete
MNYNTSNNQELGYKVYKSDYPYAQQNLPSNQAGDSITGFTGGLEICTLNELLSSLEKAW